MKNLAKILNSVRTIQVTGNAEKKEIQSVVNDSRKVNANSVFVAVKGFQTDGHNFINSAISKNAAAIVLENDNNFPDSIFANQNIVKILVEDSRTALAEISDSLFDSPSKKLKLIGVTGTKGKTTTTYYVKSVLENAGLKTGLIGTINNLIGDKKVEAKRTTPESNEINSLFAEMIKADCNSCIMEVSSHALVLKRTHKLDFDGAVFTNITSDHMDFHENFENYLEAKRILFENLSEASFALLNADDKNWNRLSENSKARIRTYGFDEKADYKISNLEYDLNGTKFCIEYDSRRVNVFTKLIGKFNAYNATAAFGCGIELGFEPEKIVKGIENNPHVPGRMELIRNNGKRVLIDYSHTAGSLKEALLSIKHINTENRPVYTVFGCGGDRDRTKRPEMGRIATELSFKAIVTSDNPRTEDPKTIIADILKGIKSNNYEVSVDREMAIKKAITESEDGAVILIAGKGHEEYSEVNGVKTYFSDKQTALKYLNLIAE
ncbi:MAG: UDP-N-acetylmuramoyl-L-alanyl-D-glutamate--2,6-diaminopimelate ligase [Melioribacteraceae bacterium]|nr:UDP-N-acetylmuramoyl-L-alanyl-D-glutamate--2,6-diaminopimelate ligase [Melioribacteraceae bacterium]MCF8266088.1 UDP-N-acetylmuramoyl-L-alanyl-D-glutamate--2,6-diaminopimelate ligase [Melioribacteraceae bacterium]MCF8432773.1 UDP-N-acetylmuramoyl-L-alanyl-D-glutamate--2,6-diaminopimelate ligase [Melioribacteraceae bacterium]